jgi:hypothetical protein
MRANAQSLLVALHDLREFIHHCLELLVVRQGDCCDLNTSKFNTVPLWLEKLDGERQILVKACGRPYRDAKRLFQLPVLERQNPLRLDIVDFRCSRTILCGILNFNVPIRPHRAFHDNLNSVLLLCCRERRLDELKHPWFVVINDSYLGNAGFQL